MRAGVRVRVRVRVRARARAGVRVRVRVRAHRVRLVPPDERHQGEAEDRYLVRGLGGRARVS